MQAEKVVQGNGISCYKRYFEADETRVPVIRWMQPLLVAAGTSKIRLAHRGSFSVLETRVEGPSS